LDASDRKLVKADFEYHEADNTFRNEHKLI
jgi:hypothetical protein